MESRFITQHQCNLDLCEAEIEILKIPENQNSGTSECWNLENCIWKLSCPSEDKEKLVEIVLDYCRNLKNPENSKISDTNCEKLLEELIEEVEFGNSVDLQLEICEELKNKCPSLTSLQKSRIQKSCKLLEFQKNPISKCFENLKFSKNLNDDCLGNIDFFNFARLSVCNFDEVNLKICTRGIIQRECGDDVDSGSSVSRDRSYVLTRECLQPEMTPNSPKCVR
ncbi:hypothetical protein B9Z55_021721 [Caenorhabditis nigoni]|nr:hypothetical protein B9Z55_021721 [Caenorhabditis nigoni]